MAQAEGENRGTTARVSAMIAVSATAVLEWWWAPAAIAQARGYRAFGAGTGLLLLATIPLPLFAVLLAARWALREKPVRIWRCVAAGSAALVVCGIPSLWVALQR